MVVGWLWFWPRSLSPPVGCSKFIRMVKEKTYVISTSNPAYQTKQEKDGKEPSPEERDLALVREFVEAHKYVFCVSLYVYIDKWGWGWALRDRPTDRPYSYTYPHNRQLLNALVRQQPALLERTLAPLVLLPQCRGCLDFDNKKAYFRAQVNNEKNRVLCVCVWCVVDDT